MNSKVAVSLLLFSLSLQVNGWWDTGHMLVSQVALKHLEAQQTSSPQAAAVYAALQNAVNSLVSYSPASNTFVTAACWMDDLKTRNLHSFDNWHFINLPICDYTGENITDSCDGISVESVLDSDEEDVIWAIGEATSTISSKYALGFERGFALRNLLHLVGDLHQPLHTVAMYSNFTPNGDLGGNLWPVPGVPYANNLHKLWDSGVGMLNNYITRPLNTTNENYLSTLADSLITRVAPIISNVTQKVNATAWALETRELAILYTYNLTFNSTPDAYYIAQAWEVIQDQIGLAGYRLFLILNQTYTCSSALGNCPDTDVVPAKKEMAWFITGITLACVLGVSLIINVVLCVRGRRAGYKPVM